jgi:hypothetical protein
MSAQRKPEREAPEPEGAGEWVQVPAVIDANGDRVITLFDEHGRPQTRPVAELVLEALEGPRPPGHVVRFKDGDRLNCRLDNLEWAAPEDVQNDNPVRARAIETRRRADEMRRQLEGRHHSDSGELQAEDRLR